MKQRGVKKKVTIHSVRRAVQAGIAGFFILLPVLNENGFDVIWGNFLNIHVGSLTFSDPLAVLQGIVKNRYLPVGLLISAGMVLAIAFCLGTVFCSWICPFGLLSELAYPYFANGYSPNLIIAILLIIWVFDTGAYFVGTSFGKHKLCPRLSPKKTWEGFWGGLITGVAAGALFPLLLKNMGINIPPLRGAILGLVLALGTPLGDLAVSMIKRQVARKDSGNLLPGHGGAFDRLDTLLWAMPISYYLILFLFPRL